MHTGRLEEDSPGLSRTLTGMFEPESITAISEAYSNACSNGALFEERLTRKDGASYNPRPARVCEILIKEEGIEDPNVLAAAMYACCTESGERPDADHVAQMISAIPTPASEESSLIAMALMLDFLRHLHMTDFSNEERRVIIKGAEEEFLPALDANFGKRLRVMIETSLSRSEKSLGVRSE